MVRVSRWTASPCAFAPSGSGNPSGSSAAAPALLELELEPELDPLGALLLEAGRLARTVVSAEPPEPPEQAASAATAPSPTAVVMSRFMVFSPLWRYCPTHPRGCAVTLPAGSAGAASLAAHPVGAVDAVELVGLLDGGRRASEARRQQVLLRVRPRRVGRLVGVELQLHHRLHALGDRGGVLVLADGDRGADGDEQGEPVPAHPLGLALGPHALRSPDRGRQQRHPGLLRQPRRAR